jgi:hypothetical protein
MKTYEFTITIVGTGEDKEDAWTDACEGFSTDWGVCPDDEDCKLTIEED